jgi:hypothetical protein
MLLFDHLVGGCEQRRRHCQVKDLAALRLIARYELGRLFGGMSAGLVPRKSSASCRERLARPLRLALRSRGDV